MAIKLAEVDLAQPWQPIYADPRYDQLWVLVRWGQFPLGIVRQPCPSGPHTFSVEQLQTQVLGAVGWQIWEHGVVGSLNYGNATSDSTLPPISVVLCTRDRALSLERCLQALAQLDYPTYEVVVVDNCSRDPAVAQTVARSGFRYVREDRPGLDWARNRGIQEARHDIIAYVDDDALAAPGWLRGIARGFEPPDVMAVTGLVFPAEIETNAQRDFEAYGGMSKGFVGRTIQPFHPNNPAQFWASSWGVGANMAFRRSLFETIGHFDVALDVGTPTCGGGDIEFFYRTVAAGYRLRYEPSAMVRHIHRRDDAALRRLVYNNGRSFVGYLLTVARNQPTRRAAVLKFALTGWFWPWVIRRLAGAILHRDRWTLRLVLMELWGSLSGPGAYRASQKVAARLLAG